MRAFKNSLYRYYRPSNFSEFVGQKSVVTILKNQVKNQSFNHALLFTGPRGCGKTSLARIFAKAINCELNSQALSVEGEIPCNQCPLCVQAQENKALNIIELDGASNNGVEEIRNLIENSRLSAIGAIYKVFIIDEVHMLSKAAFNALLKTLEEPPKHVIFILATTEVDKIPPTISSRCQVFNFHKIKKTEMIERLTFVGEKEKINLTEPALNEIFYLSEGSLRDALNILQQLIATENQNIDLNLVQEYFQIPTQKEKIKVLKSLLKNQAQDLISYFETINQQGLNLDLFILGLLDLIKEIIEFKVTNNSEFLKQISIAETEILASDLKRFFVIGDALSDAFQKNKSLRGDYNYILIDLLKTIQGDTTILNKADNSNSIHQQSTPEKTTKLNLKFDDFLKLHENLLSQPRDFLPIKISNDQIFNVLVASSKLARDEIEAKVNNFFVQDNQNHLLEPELAQAFVSWYNGTIVAVSDCEILIRFNHEEELNFFQESLKDAHWAKILETNFNFSFGVYGIDRKHWEVIKREFIWAKKNNLLKPHYHVTWTKIYGSMENEVQEKKEFAALANHLFGDLVELEENDFSNK